MQVKTDYDYTSMSTFMTCQRKYNLRVERGLVGKQAQGAPEFGKWIHAALDEWYKSRSLEQAIRVFKDGYVQPEDEDKRTHLMGETILKNYEKQYRDQPFKLIASEQEFCLPLPNGNNLIGRIDKIIEWNKTLWILDHKTTSMLGPTYFRMAEPNLQFTGYVWAARQLGYNVVGVIVDAILVAKGLLPGERKSSTLTPFARYDVYMSDARIQEWLETVQNIQYQIQSTTNRIPNFDACTYYGECPYRRICKEDSSIRERIIENDYKVEFWDPREKELAK